MGLPRVSVATMAFAVLICAADFGLLHNLDELEEILGPWTILALGLLPMANALALGLPGLLRRGRRPGFAVGFQAVGWTATLGVVAAFAAFPDVLEVIRNTIMTTPCAARSVRSISQPPEPAGLLESCRDALDDLLGPGMAELLVGVASIMAFFSLPPWLAAMAGGVVAHLSAAARPGQTNPTRPGRLGDETNPRTHRGRISLDFPNEPGPSMAAWAKITGRSRGTRQPLGKTNPIAALCPPPSPRGRATTPPG
jgi:hypothetical protein